MGFMVYSLLWVMQDLYHQPYEYYYCTSCLGGATADDCFIENLRLAERRKGRV